MFDFSKELIQSDTVGVLKDITYDLIFKNTLHTYTPLKHIKNGDYVLLNYKGFLCYLVNNSGDPYIVLSTKYNSIGSIVTFADMQEI